MVAPHASAIPTSNASPGVAALRPRCPASKSTQRTAPMIGTCSANQASR